jgi:hypothetical protein
LNKGGAESSVDLVPEGDGGGRKGGPIAFDEESPFPEGGSLPFLSGGGFGVWGGDWGRGSLSSVWGGGLLLLWPLCDRGPSRGGYGRRGL